MVDRALRRGLGALANIALVVSAAVAAVVFLVPALRGGTPERGVAPQATPPVAEADLNRAVEPFSDAIPVLTYHDVSPDSDSPWAVTPQTFAEHMAALADAGFDTVTLDDVHALTSGREPTLPDRPVLLTFDDGVAGNWVHADPVLRRHGYNAVAFVVTGVVADRQPSYYLSWNELEAMRDSGRWELEAHTHSGHGFLDEDGRDVPWLTNLVVDDSGRPESLDAWRHRVTRDLDTNQSVLGSELGVDTTALAYPFSASRHPTNHPDIPDELAAIVQQRFDLAFSAFERPLAVTPGADRHLLPRLPSITKDTSAAELLDSIERSIPRPPPSDLTSLQWTGDGGRCHTVGSAVVLRSETYATCRPAVDNGGGWLDYRLALSVRGTDRNATVLIGVRSGPAGRVEVAVGESSYVVRQHISGTWRELATGRVPAGEPRDITVEVEGAMLTLKIGDIGRRVRIDERLRSGAVVFGVAANRTSQLRFEDTTITQLGPTRTAG